MNQLYRGIFWIRDTDDIPASALYFRIPCDSSGNICDANFTIPPEMASEDGDNYNHKKVWDTLPRNITNGKPYHYYPRGRVQIRRGIAKIFVSPHIPKVALLEWLTDIFHLTPAAGIHKTQVIYDRSAHYRCHLDVAYQSR